MLDKLQGKKIAVVGLGVNNKKLAEFFDRQGIKYTVVDGWKNTDELQDKLSGFEVIFRSPGLPFLSKAIQKAKVAGAEILSQTKLFFAMCPSPIIGVTGTKGKGTTSSLIAKILEISGKKSWLGGNIGTDPFEFIDQIKPEDYTILELSSFQLQDLEKSPHVAVVLSITPDHLNYHKDFDEYIRAKSSILTAQLPKDFAILHPTLPDWFKNLGRARKIFIDPIKVKDYERKLLGDHNLDNISAAVNVGMALGIPEETIKKAVALFEPLPHRLAVLRTVNDVTYVDDAFSTNIDPTIAAVAAIDSKLVLITGGSDKGLDFTRLGQAIQNSKKIRGVIIIGQVTDQILKSLGDFKGSVLTGASTMEEILTQANELAQRGDTVLFSPGTASFGMFKNEHDRAAQFEAEVKKIS